MTITSIKTDITHISVINTDYWSSCIHNIQSHKQKGYGCNESKKDMV